VVPAGPPSPSSSNGDLTPKGETYYRPSTQVIINHLKRKVDHFAAPETYEKFDHLVRGLGRDGLLETSANPELVARMFPPSASLLELMI
jgi:ribonuclease H2 subunit B